MATLSELDSSMRRLILLGPQPRYQSLIAALDRLQIDGPIGLITAGWQEDELDCEEIESAISRPLINAQLFHRSERLFTEDPELINRLRERQDQLRQLRDVYRLRLEPLLATARELFRRNFEIDVQREQDQVLQQLRDLDQLHYLRTDEVCDRYDARLNLSTRESVLAQRQEVVNALRDTKALVISGGHAGIILNRLKIFGLLELFPQLPVIAWSAGAMALADRIVFFHDFPPHGPGNPEILRAGMALFQDRVLLPNASKRLQLDDRTRVSLFARRFWPRKCILMDEQTLLDRNRGKWEVVTDAKRLSASGDLEKVTA